MRKFLSIATALVFLSTNVYATAVQSVLCQTLGLTTNGAVSATESLSAAGNEIGFSFVAQANTSLSAVRYFITGALTGTGGIVLCQLQSDSNGAPSGTVLDTLTPDAISGNSWHAATGGTFSLTRGTKYFVVFSDTDTSPTTNFFKLAYINNAGANVAAGDDAEITTTSGVSWTQKNCGGGIRFDFADGTFLGSPISVAGTINNTATETYSSNEVGIKFTTPANGKMVVRGLAMYETKVGTPTGNIFFKLYDASHTLLGSTFAVSNGDAITNTSQWYHRNFDPTTISGGADTITLSPSTTYTVTLAETTQSDTSSNCFRVFAYTWDTDASSLAMLPWSQVMDSFNAGSWSTTTNLVVGAALLLQSGGEFASTGSGGGTISVMTVGQ